MIQELIEYFSAKQSNVIGWYSKCQAKRSRASRAAALLVYFRQSNYFHPTTPFISLSTSFGLWNMKNKPTCQRNYCCCFLCETAVFIILSLAVEIKGLFETFAVFSICDVMLITTDMFNSSLSSLKQAQITCTIMQSLCKTLHLDNHFVYLYTI